MSEMIYTNEERNRINSLCVSEEQRHRLLQRVNDIEVPASREFSDVMERYLLIEKRYRVFGFDTLGEVFEAIRQKVLQSDPSGYELIQNNFEWLSKGLYKQESLLFTFIDKYESVETIHNLRLRNVDHAIALWQNVVERIQLLNL